MIGQDLIDCIIKNGLLKSHCKNVTVWKNNASDHLDKYLKMWSTPRRINALKEGESVVLFTDDHLKTMREIEASKSRGQITIDYRLKKASVIIGDELKIGVYIERVK